MASCQRIGTEPDLISELPEDIKQRILECLPTRDAARTTLLSPHWNGVWLRHGRLVFDQDFFRGCVRKCEGDKSMSVANIINNILLLHVGPVKKFTLDIYEEIYSTHPWLLFLSRNGVEELNLSDYRCSYTLPFCMFVCPTIKKLKLCGFCFNFPGNAIFSGVTSLVFEAVFFSGNDNGAVYSFPKLEKLAFESCCGIHNFVISAPKLRSLSAISYINFVINKKPRWLTVHLEAIKALCLSPDLVMDKRFRIPMAINLQVIKLDGLRIACGRHFIFTMQLLQKSPNLCKLEIVVKKLDTKAKAVSRIFANPDHYVINQNLMMLNTVKIESFSGCKLEMLLVKTLISKSPALEKLVIKELDSMNPAMARNISRKLLHFPRASPKAQLVFEKCRDRDRCIIM